MKSDVEQGIKLKPAPMLFSCRLALFTICLLTTFTFLLQRVNIGFALVCMVKRTNLTSNTRTAININTSSLNQDFLTSTISSYRDELLLGLPTTTSPRSPEHDGNGSNFLLNNPDLNLIQTRILTEDEECRSDAIIRATDLQASHNYVDEGEFEWSREVQGSILGSFYYGYVFTQVFGGWLAERFGARLGLLSSLLMISLLTLLNPAAATLGVEYLFAVRLLMGLSHGAAISSINIFSVRWCAPAERAFLMGIAYGGFCIAAALCFPICAFLCKTFGWRSIFYATGGWGLLVMCLAYFLVYDWPEKHPRISERELSYLQKACSVQYSARKASKTMPTPWKKILLSVPINVVHVTHICFVWGFLMIGMYLPTFMKEVLYLDIGKNGVYSSLPYVGMLLVHFSVGSIFDFFRKKNFCSLTNLRKTFNTIGMICPAISLMMTGFLSCKSPGTGIIIISIAQGFAEFGFMGGYMFSIFELAPKYAGVLTGITNTFGVIPGFVCPAIVAYLTPNGTRSEWIVVFLLAGGLNLFGALTYLLFGSSEIQPWAVTATNQDIIRKDSSTATNGDPSAVKKPMIQEMVDLHEKLLIKN